MAFLLDLPYVERLSLCPSRVVTVHALLRSFLQCVLSVLPSKSVPNTRDVAMRQPHTNPVLMEPVVQ